MTKKTAITTSEDWHRADVVAELKKSGWSVRQLSRQAGLCETTLYSALEKPYLKGERIIATALGIPAEKIWPQRYAARKFSPTFPKEEAILNKLM